MIKALCKKSRENKGFSLIELIVVIAILGILALILVPRFMDLRMMPEKLRMKQLPGHRDCRFLYGKW